MTSDIEQMKADFLAPLGINPTPTETPAPVEPTNVTPPATETAPPTTTEPTPTPTQTDTPPAIELNDEVKLKAINDYFGTGFNSIEEAQSIKNAYGEFPTLQEYKKRVEEYEANPVETFFNDDIRELNNFAKAGISDMSLVRQLKRFEVAETKDPIEALVLAEILKNPHKADSKDMVRKIITRQYKTTFDPDLEGEDLARAKEDAELEQFRLSSDAAVAKDEINKVLTGVKSTTGPTLKEMKEKEQSVKAHLQNVLTPHTEKLFSKIPVQVPVGKDGKEELQTVDEINLTPQEQQKYVSLLIDRFAASGQEITTESISNELSKIHDAIRMENYSRTLSKVMSDAKANALLEAEKKYSNPSGAPRIETPPTPSAPKTSSQILQERMSELGW